MADRFTRLPGKSRNYKDHVTDAIVSRRQRDKIMEAEGARKRMTLERAAVQRRAQNYNNRWLGEYVAQQQERGKTISRKDARESQEFKDAIAMLRGKLNKPPAKASDAERVAFERRQRHAMDIARNLVNKRAGAPEGVNNEYTWRKGRLTLSKRGRAARNIGRKLGK